MSADENIGSSAKRQRLDNHESEREGQTSRLSRLERIPLEILAEVLFHVNSPKDVLSVTRCSKHLCATLLNPSNVMIWRRARGHCVVPDLPPPLPGWSESAYAAFIFDSGKCYVCHVLTKRMFWSFVARVRLCPKHECRKKFFDDYVMVQSHPNPSHSESKSRFYEERLRYLEMPAVNLAGAPYHYCLSTDVINTTMEYEEMIAGNVPQDEYLQGLKTAIQRQHRILDHAKILYPWSQQWCHRYRDTVTSNMAFARKLATESGWSLQDLLNTSTYGSLHRSYNTCLEKISNNDVRLLFTKIDAEILSQVENRERRQKTHAQQIRRADITRHYGRLVKGKSHPIVPVLTEFRELPIIKTLQDRDDMMPVLSDPARSPSTKLVKTPRVLEPELKRSELIGGMIDSDLKKWVDTALAAFDSILGQPNWKRASTRLLHPAERVTARFICTLCSSPSKRCATTESLGVREACAHQCKRNSKVATKRKWKAEYFVPDQKAICVLSKAVSLLGLRADIRETVVEIESTGARFLCKSCDSPIVMNFQRLAGHCHRHDEMQVEIVSTAEALALVEPPYDAGSFAKCTARTNEAKDMREMKAFGCRHCEYRNPEPAVARLARNSDGRWQKRFTFNGLISHAKEKHKIFPLGDEDFFRDIGLVALNQRWPRLE